MTRPSRARNSSFVQLSCVPLPVGHLKHSAQPIGERFVGAEDAEVALLSVEFDDIAQEHAEFMRVAACTRAG